MSGVALSALYDTGELDARGLVCELASRLACCPEQGIVVAGYHLNAHIIGGQAAWLAWSALSGALIQAFSTTGTEAILVPSCGAAGGCTLVTSAAAQPLAGWNVETGELLWRRSDVQLPEDSSGCLVSGSAAGAPAIAVSRRDKKQFCLSAEAGRNVAPRDFEETSSTPVQPPVVELEVPPPHRLPWKVLLGKRNPLPDWGGALSLGMADRLATAAPADSGRSVSGTRRLQPSAPVARQLARIMAVENLGTSAHLTVAEAQTITSCLGGADDDVLATYAVRSPFLRRAWGLSPSNVRELSEAGPWYAARTPRLRLLGGRSETGADRLVALDEAWNGQRIALVTPYGAFGPQPLAAWLSEAVWEMSGGAEVSTGDVEFAIGAPRESGRAHVEASGVVAHPKFGRGRVVSQSGDTVTVLFETHGERRLKAASLRPADS